MHLEGPYISPEDGPRGAHARQHVRPPDWDEFRRLQDAAGGGIRLVTLAPEHDGALPFIERLTASGVVVALGHTAAAGPRIRDAIRAGARLSTHLGNGAHAVLPRHPNYLWDQLADDDLWASIITDGHHLPPSVVRCILRVKTPARTILTCDAGSLAGLPQGRYRSWDQEFEVVPEGKIIAPGTGYLAGSWAFTDQCVQHVLGLGEVSLRDALDMAGARPRSLLGLPPRSLEAGQPADLLVCDWTAGNEWRLRGTVVKGMLTWP
jgi:N-acetylglucosamine-6-phosphate deacetylase